jgi:hypothetical protein
MHQRSRTSVRIVLAAGLVLAAAAPAQAQQALAPSTPPVDVAAPSRSQPAPAPAQTAAPSQVGPTMDAASTAVRQPASTEAPAPFQARRAGYGQPVALMVVGGAALLAGLIIGGGAGTAIAVGGAVVGLYGLYEFLQ